MHRVRIHWDEGSRGHRKGFTGHPQYAIAGDGVDGDWDASGVLVEDGATAELDEYELAARIIEEDSNFELLAIRDSDGELNCNIHN